MTHALGAHASGGIHRRLLGGVEVDLWFTPITEHTLRISIIPAVSHLQPREAFASKGLRDRASPQTSAWPQSQEKLSVAVHPEPLAWGKFRICISDDPLTIGVQQAGTDIQRLKFDQATGKVSFDLQDMPLFGLGEGGRQFDRRGAVDSMRNGQFKPDQLVNGGRSPIPWLISPSGWGIYFHQPMGTFDLAGKEGIFRPAESMQTQDIFLVVAKEPGTLLKEFAQLTGFPHLPPLWALGYQQSHRTLTSREEVLQEAATFRQKKLPCDVMIYLGTGFAPSGWNTGHGSFAFNPKIFPDPQAMFQEMHLEDFRIVLHVLGAPYDLHGRVSDHSHDPDDAANYWLDHLNVFQTGIDGWWVDDGDELLPESRLARNRMYWEGPLRQRPNVRPYSIQRNGYAGLQQYGFLWSGDVNSAWQTLRTQIAAGLNTALSGIPYWGTDTGGFFSTKELTAELYIRWFQFSAFCPLFRSHGRTWKLRLPWGWNTGELGPVEDDPKMLPTAEDLHHPEVEEICRRYLNLRYQLLPYLYSTVHEAHTTGMPIMRALWLAFPADSRALAVDDSYMWGKSLLVAPVTVASATERQVYLPHGGWIDFWTNEVLQGGSDTTKRVDVATLPLYVKTGTILPLGPVKQSALQKNSSPLELHIYPGDDGHFTLYEDDGTTMDHTRGIYSMIEMRWKDKDRSLSVELAPGSSLYPFTTQTMNVQLVGGPAAKVLEFHGDPITLVL